MAEPAAGAAEPVPAEPEAQAPATLTEALMQWQGEAHQVSKDAEADTGKYKYKYLTLDKLLEEVLPKLTELGLLWQTSPAANEQGVPILRYSLTFVATEGQISGTFPLMVKPGATPQDLGGALTYARRYALVTVLNIGQPDDDGRVDRAPGGAGGSQTGVRRLTKAKAEQLVTKADQLPKEQRGLLQMAATHAHGGEDVGACDTKANAVKALQRLNAEEGEKVANWIAKKSAEALGVGGED
jgi:hypothetical protein